MFCILSDICHPRVFWLFPIAEQRVSSGIAGILNGAVPLFAAAIAVLVGYQFRDEAIEVFSVVAAGTWGEAF